MRLMAETCPMALRSSDKPRRAGNLHRAHRHARVRPGERQEMAAHSPCPAKPFGFGEESSRVPEPVSVTDRDAGSGLSSPGPAPQSLGAAGITGQAGDARWSTPSCPQPPCQRADTRHFCFHRRLAWPSGRPGLRVSGEGQPSSSSKAVASLERAAGISRATQQRWGDQKRQTEKGASVTTSPARWPQLLQRPLGSLFWVLVWVSRVHEASPGHPPGAPSSYTVA